ncbi:MAG: PH domain-containing protein [Planctomycetaceae bacterium]|jgi:membrane protein YdbS with pleckstrin-like domain|nr:PH domain-containing protein [Planctomycetaceae bacterium]
MDFLEDKFNDILDRNETIFWTGIPNFWTWMFTAVPVLVIGLFWGVIDIGFSTVWLYKAPAEMNYFFIPFMCVHSFPCWGSILYVFYRYLSHKNVAYAFTNKRVMIRSGLFGIDYQIIDYDKIQDIQVNVNPIEKICNVGSILLNTGNTGNNSNGYVIKKGFRGIENLMKFSAGSRRFHLT